MSLYIIRMTGKKDGWTVQDVLKDGAVVEAGVSFETATTIVQDLMKPDDFYQEEEAGRVVCRLTYAEICASWARTAAFDRGEI